MKTMGGLHAGMTAIAVALFLAGGTVPMSAQQAGSAQVAIDSDDIGGVVRGPSGPEAGVWVIAETTDLPTKFARIVVTDDQGRYVIPDLPKAKYKVWVRGYGLVDSPKVDGEPGKLLDLSAVAAPNEAAAAQYYPAIYWYSMLKIPDASQFGGKSKIPDKITQTDWLTTVKNRNCIGCHQLGQLSTRTIPAALGEFKSGEDAWIRRVQSGQSAENMVNPLGGPRRRAVQVLRRLDRPRRQGRAAARQAQAAARRRAQYRGHDLGMGRPEEVPARPDRFRSPLSDGQCLRAALWLARILHRRHADPRSQDAQGGDLQDAGARRGHAGGARARTCRAGQAHGAVALLGRREDLGHQGQQSQRHVRQEGPGVDGGDLCAAWTIRPSARRAPITPPPRCFRWNGRLAR